MRVQFIHVGSSSSNCWTPSAQCNASTENAPNSSPPIKSPAANPIPARCAGYTTVYFLANLVLEVFYSMNVDQKMHGSSTLTTHPFQGTARQRTVKSLSFQGISASRGHLSQKLRPQWLTFFKLVGELLTTHLTIINAAFISNGFLRC